MAILTEKNLISLNEMKHNGSGYYDPTAFAVLRGIQREEGKMGVRSDYQDGDIVTLNRNGYTDEALILKCHENYASATLLREKAPMENSVAVISRQKMYFDAGRLCYLFYDNIAGYIKTVSTAELERIRGKVSKSLGIEPKPQENEPQEPVTPDGGAFHLHEDDIKHLEAVIKETAAHIEPLEAAELTVGAPDGYVERSALIKAEAERDIYRELYEKERARS